jgi:hypothetical protein
MSMLSALVNPNRETILEMVKALALYCEKGGYHAFSFSSLQLEAMGAYRNAIRAAIPDANGPFNIETTVLYRMAMTWGQVLNAMQRHPNEQLFQLIWEVVSGVYQSHPMLTAQLQQELPAAEAVCRLHDLEGEVAMRMVACAMDA